MICVAGRFVGLANAAYFISDPVLIGFKTGAALYIASTLRCLRDADSLPRLLRALPARPADKPPTGAGWLHEIKHDGFRMLVRRNAEGRAAFATAAPAVKREAEEDWGKERWR
jgi:hypothetical protein